MLVPLLLLGGVAAIAMSQRSKAGQVMAPLLPPGVPPRPTGVIQPRPPVPTIVPPFGRTVFPPARPPVAPPMAPPGAPPVPPPFVPPAAKPPPVPTVPFAPAPPPGPVPVGPIPPPPGLPPIRPPMAPPGIAVPFAPPPPPGAPPPMLALPTTQTPVVMTAGTTVDAPATKDTPAAKVKLLPVPPQSKPMAKPSVATMDEAARQSMTVMNDLIVNGTKYNKEAMKSFQRLALLSADGLYGPRTAGAIAYYSGRIPPKPFAKGAGGLLDIVLYRPPGL